MEQRIVYLKTCTGEDILASVVKEDMDSWTITYPLAVESGFDEAYGRISRIIPWIPFDEFMSSNYELHKRNILTVIDLHGKAAKYYKSAVTKLTVEDPNQGKNHVFVDEPSSNPNDNELMSQDDIVIAIHDLALGKKTIH